MTGLVQLPWGSWVAPWHVTSVHIGQRKNGRGYDSPCVVVSTSSGTALRSGPMVSGADKMRDEVATLIATALAGEVAG